MYSAAGSCEPDDDSWKFYRDRCYYFGTEERTWWNALTFCTENGGYLVSIHDEDANNFIKGQVRASHNETQDEADVTLIIQPIFVMAEEEGKQQWGARRRSMASVMQTCYR